ncbi:MAG: hypothetical protein LUF87_03095 [Alistipes sp.]|nr:hypothetical protein [Alistipes sp.]
MRTRKSYILTAVTIVMLLFAGCVKEDIYTGTDGTEDEIEFTFAFDTGPLRYDVTTRGVFIDEQIENRIKEIDIMVYEIDPDDGSEIFTYHRNPIALTYDWQTGKGTFTVRLARSQNGEEYSFDFLANCSQTLLDAMGGGYNYPSNYGGPVSRGMTREEIQKSLRYNAATPDINSDTWFPFWAGYDQNFTVDFDTDFPALSFIRSFVKIDIGFNLDENNVAHGIENYKLKGIRAGNPPAGGLLLPLRENIVGGVAIAPSVYATIESGTRILQSGITDDRVINGLYFYEPDVNALTSIGGSFCLVMHCEYTDPNTGTVSVRYYPLHLTQKEDPTKKQPLLRNHYYRVNILDIRSEGYSSVTTAAGIPFENVNAGVNYELHVQEEGKINHIVYSPRYYLGISTIYESFNVNGAYAEMYVRTNVPLGWEVEFVDDVGAPATWVYPTDITSGSPDVTYTVDFTVENNAYSIPRTAFAKFTAGELEITAELYQPGRTGGGGS